MFRCAAIDVGTHSVRLLVVEGASGRPARELLRRQRITRLGDAWRPGSALHPEAVERTLLALREFARDVDSLGVQEVRAVATSVVREARDGREFVDLVRRETGLALRVIDGLEEAALSFRGVVAGVVSRPDAPAPSDIPERTGGQPGAVSGSIGVPLIVVDVGGGSTELAVGVICPSGLPPKEEAAPAGGAGGDEGTVLGHRYRLLAKETLPLGAVRLTEAFLHGDPPTDDEWEGLVEHIRTVVAGPVARQGGVPARGAAPLLRALAGRGENRIQQRMIGVGGTATSLAAIDQQLEKYDRDKVHGYRMPAGRVREWAERLRRMPLAERQRLVGLQPRRAPVAHAGAAIVAGVVDVLGASFLEVSDWDLLEGLIYS